MRLKSPATGIEPPEPRSTASLPHSAVRASRACFRWMPVVGTVMAGLPPCSVKVTVQSSGTAGAHVLAEGGADFVGVHARDKAEADLGAGFGRDHGLETFAGVAADHAVDLAGGARDRLLEDGAVLLAGGDRKADGSQEFVAVEAELTPSCRR